MADLYLGTLGGEDFSTAKALTEWLCANPLTGDQNIYITSNGADTVPYVWTANITLNGYHLNLSVEDSTWNSIKNDPTKWFTWSFGDGCAFFFPINTAGTFTQQRFKAVATHKNAGHAFGNAIVSVYSGGGVAIGPYNFKNIIIVGGKNQTGSSTIKDCINIGRINTTYVNVENVIVMDSVRDGFATNITTFTPGTYLGRKYIKNCAALNCARYGMYIDGHASFNWTLQNSYSVENLTDWLFYDVDNSTKQSLADSDSTLPDIAGMQRGITIANEVQSTDITSADFLKLIKGTIEGTSYNPGSTYLGQTGIDSGLTSDILGRSIPGVDSLYSIGAFQSKSRKALG